MKYPIVQSSVSHEASPSESGYGFHWQTSWKLFGLPLCCISFGRNSSGRARIAKGWISIGKIAVGLIAIGQFSLGIISLGIVGVGLIAVGQVAAGILFGLGQISTGIMAIGQVVIGHFGLGQIGWATYLWSQNWTDMEAVAAFSSVRMMILNEGGIEFGEVMRGAIDWGTDWLKSVF